jgi:hypothetical protein
MTNSIIHVWKSITREQTKDTGITISLIMLIAGYLTEIQLFYTLSIPLLLFSILLPVIFYPFAFVLFGLAKIMGTLSQKVIFSVVYFVIVYPVAFFQKFLGKDTLHLKEFKKSTPSVFHIKNHEFESKDFEKPF